MQNPGKVSHLIRDNAILGAAKHLYGNGKTATIRRLTEPGGRKTGCARSAPPPHAGKTRTKNPAGRDEVRREARAGRQGSVADPFRSGRNPRRRYSGRRTDRPAVGTASERHTAERLTGTASGLRPETKSAVCGRKACPAPKPAGRKRRTRPETSSDTTRGPIRPTSATGSTPATALRRHGAALPEKLRRLPGAKTLRRIEAQHAPIRRPHRSRTGTGRRRTKRLRLRASVRSRRPDPRLRTRRCRPPARRLPPRTPRRRCATKCRRPPR